MPTLSVYIKLLLVAAALAGPALGQAPCSFPAYLRARPRWEAELSVERRVIGAFWQFKVQSMETLDLSKPDATPVVYTCYRQEAADRFVLKFDSADNHRTEFTCLKFIQRSPYVIQVMRSQSTSTTADTNLCADSSLVMDSSPLVWPQPEEFIPTSEIFMGGFQFTITDHATGFDLCQSATLLPVWEADCMPGDGISIDFRQFQCRGDLGMELVQKLYNLGTWEQGIHQYTLVTDLSELWARLWLLRAPAKPANPDKYDIDLFTSISTTEDSSKPDSMAHYTLHLKRASFPSLCADEASYCTSCDTNRQNVNCLKTCQSTECLKLANQAPCTFNSNDQGNWVEYSNSGARSVNVTTQSISIQSQSKRSCLDLKTEFWFEKLDRRTVLTMFDNGCKPRYQCAEFHRRSDSVLQFQIGDVSVWPQPLPLNPGELCTQEKFDVVKKSAVQKELHPFRWRALLNMNTLHSGSVSCDITGRFYLMVYTATGETCLGNIDTCQGNPNSFDFNQGNQCTTSIATSHSCLASFTNEQNGDKILITRSTKTTMAAGSTTVSPTDDSPTADYLCWVFHRGEWDPAPRLYLTHASDCHTEIANDIAYRNFTGYLAQFDVAAGSGPMGSYECSGNTDNPFGAFTTNKQATSKSPVGGNSDDSSKMTASLVLISLAYLIARIASR